MTDEALKQAIVVRARDFGHSITADDVTVRYMDGEPVPGIRPFCAHYKAVDNRAAICGVVEDGKEPDTQPRRALGKVFRRWLERDGHLPDPGVVADTTAFIIGSAGPLQVLHTEEEVAEHVRPEAWRPHVRPPQDISEPGRPGVAFWWLYRTDLSEVRVVLEGGQRLEVSQKFIRDFLPEAAE